jgi:hypothetical protein
MAAVTYSQLTNADYQPLNVARHIAVNVPAPIISFVNTEGVGSYTTSDAGEQTFLNALIVSHPTLLKVAT